MIGAAHADNERQRQSLKTRNIEAYDDRQDENDPVMDGG